MDQWAFAPLRRAKSQLSVVTGTSTSKYIPLNESFGDALLDYKKRTREDLRLHPLSSSLKNCKSPDDVLLVLEQTRALNQSRNSVESPTRLLQLGPTVNVLCHLSQGIADRVESVGPASSPATAIFAAIGVFLLVSALLDFCARTVVIPKIVPAVQGLDSLVDSSRGAIVETFETTGRSLQRLENYIKVQPTEPMKDVIEQVMLAVLSILALATEEIRQGQSKKSKTPSTSLRQKPGVEDVLKTLEELTQTPPQDDIRRWLSSSDPSENYGVALKSRHEGTAQWFLQSETFAKWKSTGPFLWVDWKPGSGKSVLCAAIIEHIEAMSTGKSEPACMAYFFFDSNDDHKQSCHDMTASLLTQLSARSKPCYDILSRLYFGHNRGARMPTSRIVTECLKEMLSLPTQDPVYIILDAIDECPNTRGVPSPREEILGLVKELVEFRLLNLRLCVTCRREYDISAVFDPLNPSQLSLQTVPGQREDIVKYITDIVHSDPNFRIWSEHDKQLAIDTLSERADGMFLWVTCQMDSLRHSPLSTVRRILNEFPETLGGTYERILMEISITKRKRAQRLFHSLTVAIRPLHVEELVEILAMNPDDGEATPETNLDWRREDPEQAVLSVCSTLVEVVNLNGFKVVQFFHPSIKEFLTSDRLAASRGLVSHYRVDLELAHTILARACLSVLLQFDAQRDSDNLKRSPLVAYAARHWVDHARSDNVASHVQAEMKQLFDPEKLYFANWVKIYDMDKPPGLPTSRPTQPNTTPLYYAILCDLPDLADYLIYAHPQDVGVRGGQYTTAIHAALSRGHLSTARLLIEKGADVNSRDNDNWTPLHIAAQRGYSALVELLLSKSARERNETRVADASATTPDHSFPLIVVPNDAGDNRTPTPLHLASVTGNPKIVELLIDHNADLNALDVTKSTPLHLALVNENFDVVKLLIQYDANVNVPDHKNVTPLHLAAINGNSDAIKLLLQKNAEVNAQDDNKSTPLHLAADSGTLQAVELLLDGEANANARDNKRSMPLHLASRRGSLNIVKLLLERGADLNAQNDKGWTPLHIASQEGAFEVVQCLLELGANVHIRDGDGRTPLHVASNNKHTKVVALLIDFGADPSAQDARKLTPLQLETAGLSPSPSERPRTLSARSDVSSSRSPGAR